MAQHLVVTESNEFTEGNEVISYLRKEDVMLTEEQCKKITEMRISLGDLTNMSIKTDPTTFNELCNELSLSIGPKLKFRSAIINLQSIMATDNDKNTFEASDSDEAPEVSVRKITIALIGAPSVGKTSIMTRFLDNTFINQRIQTVGG